MPYGTISHEVRHDMHGFYVCTNAEAALEDEGNQSVGFDGRPHYRSIAEAMRSIVRHPEPVNARLLAALKAVLPYAESRTEDLETEKAAGNEDTDFSGAAEAVAAVNEAFTTIAEAEAQPNLEALLPGNDTMEDDQRADVLDKIDEAEAQAKPDAPSYADLLDWIGTIGRFTEIGNNPDTYNDEGDDSIATVNSLANSARGLLKRAGR